MPCCRSWNSNSSHFIEGCNPGPSLPKICRSRWAMIGQTSNLFPTLKTPSRSHYHSLWRLDSNSTNLQAIWVHSLSPSWTFSSPLSSPFFSAGFSSGRYYIMHLCEVHIDVTDTIKISAPSLCCAESKSKGFLLKPLTIKHDGKRTEKFVTSDNNIYAHRCL